MSTRDTHNDIADACRSLALLHGDRALIADLWPTRVEEPAPVTTAFVTYGMLKKLLQGKNALYGDSALNPVRVFSRASPVEQLLVRIDDKLSRMRRGGAGGEEIEKDLLGYLVLLRIARGRAG